jgi:hypothetical protein
LHRDHHEVGYFQSAYDRMVLGPLTKRTVNINR